MASLQPNKPQAGTGTTISPTPASQPYPTDGQEYYWDHGDLKWIPYGHSSSKPKGAVHFTKCTVTQVIEELWRKGKALGLGVLHSGTPPTDEEISECVQSGGIDYLRGKPFKTNLRTFPWISPWGYDRDNGEGAMAEVAAVLSGATGTTPTTSMEPPTIAAPPAAKPPSETSDTITIRVKDQAGEETFFKVRPTTKMGKVFAAFTQRKGVQKSSVRFLLDGERITDEDTPKTLELEDSDQIDCLLEQYGGSGLASSEQQLRESLVEARKEIKALHIQNQTAAQKIKRLERFLRKKAEAETVAAPPTMKVPIDKQVWFTWLDALDEDFSQGLEEGEYDDTQQGLLQRGIDLGLVSVWRVPKYQEGKDYELEASCVGPVKDMTKVENNELICLRYNKHRILSAPLIAKHMNEEQREEMFENMISLLDIDKDRTWLSEELGEELKRHAERKRHERKRKAEAPPAQHAAKRHFCPSTRGVAMAIVEEFCDTLDMEDTNELGHFLEEDEGVLQACEDAPTREGNDHNAIMNAIKVAYHQWIRQQVV